MYLRTVFSFLFLMSRIVSAHDVSDYKTMFDKAIPHINKELADLFERNYEMDKDYVILRADNESMPGHSIIMRISEPKEGSLSRQQSYPVQIQPERQERFHHDDYESKYDRYESSSWDANTYDRNGSINGPSIKCVFTADEFNKPLMQHGVAKVVKRYESLSVQDFEDLFIDNTLPAHQRTATYFDSLSWTDQSYIFSRIELYQFEPFRTFLMKFPRCRELLQGCINHIQANGAFTQRIKKIRSFANRDPLQVITKINHNLLREMQKQQQSKEQHSYAQYESQCIAHQQEQRTQLEHLLTAYCSSANAPPNKNARKHALQKSLDDNFLTHARTSIVPDTIKSVIKQHELENTFCMLDRGSDIQLHLQSEFFSILEQVAQQQPSNKSEQDLHTTIVSSVDIANDYTVAGFIGQAIAWTDAAWAVLAYAQQCCDKVRIAGTYLNFRANNCAYQGDYMHAAGYGLASLFCHAWASFDYVIAAGQGVAQGTSNVATSIVQCGKTIVELDKDKVYNATQKIVETLCSGSKFLYLLEDIEFDLACDNDQGAMAKLEGLADTCLIIQGNLQEKLQQIRHTTKHEIVTQSCAYVTQGFLVGKMLTVFQSLFAAAHVEAVQILEVANKTKQTVTQVEKAHSLRLLSDILKTNMPLTPDAAAATITVGPVVKTTIQSLTDLTSVGACLKNVSTDAALGVVTDELIHLQNNAAQSNVPKHLRRSILTQPLLDPDDPDKNKNSKDNEKESVKREKVLDSVDTYEQARNKALEIIGEVDPHTVEPHIGRIGVGKGKITGVDWHDGKVTLRLDWDPNKGPHINITDYRRGWGSSGRSVAIPFKGDLDLVKSLLRHLNTTESVDVAIEVLKRLDKEKSLLLLLENSQRK